MSPWPQLRSGAERQVGDTQLDLLQRAAAGTGQIILRTPVKQNNREWCAMKRMVQRGLFMRHTFGAGTRYAVTVHVITDAGRKKLARELKGQQ